MDTQLNSNSLKDVEDSTSNKNAIDVNRNMGLDAFEPIDLDYRSVNDDSLSTLSDSDSSSSSLSENEDLSKKKASDVKISNCRTKGELTFDDLPKVEELNISVQESELKAIGKITGIVDSEVIVSSFKNSIPLNIDSILFLSNGKPIGRIFDVFGPVIEPLYSVRFNSAIEIQEKEFAINDIVYYAPENNETTLYVFVDSLRKEKGSDASWTHNNEPPPECLDFSDDEQEKQARLKARAKNRNCDREVISEIQNKKATNCAKSNESPQSNVFNRPFNQNKFSPQFENLSKFRFKCSSKNVSSNLVNKFTVPSYNVRPYQNRVGSYSEQFYQSSLQVPLGNNVNEKHAPLGVQQQFSPQVGLNPRRSFSDTQSMNSSEMFVRNSNLTPGFQQLNNISQPLNSPGIRMESQRTPSKTSSEILNETFFRFRNLPPPPPLPPTGVSSLFQSSHLNVQSNVNSEVPASVKVENTEQSRMSTLHFHINNASSKSFPASSTTSPSWQNPNQNSQTHSTFPLTQQGTESTIQNKNTPLFQANAETLKIQVPPKEFSGSSQNFQQHNVSSSMSTSPAPPNSFTQHSMNPSVFLRSPSPSYFVPPYQNLNFCMTPPPHINARNSNGIPFRFSPSTPPPVNVVPPFSPGPWQPFHAPLFGILPTVNNPRTLQASSTNVTPALNQRPINLQVMQGTNASPASFTSNRFPFYDQRQPPPRGFPSS